MSSGDGEGAGASRSAERKPSGVGQRPAAPAPGSASTADDAEGGSAEPESAPVSSGEARVLGRAAAPSATPRRPRTPTRQRRLAGSSLSADAAAALDDAEGGTGSGAAAAEAWLGGAGVRAGPGGADAGASDSADGDAAPEPGPARGRRTTESARPAPAPAPPRTRRRGRRRARPPGRRPRRPVTVTAAPPCCGSRRSTQRRDQPTTAIRLPVKGDGKAASGSRYVPLRSPDDAPRAGGAALPAEKPGVPAGDDAGRNHTHRARSGPSSSRCPAGSRWTCWRSSPTPRRPRRRRCAPSRAGSRSGRRWPHCWPSCSSSRRRCGRFRTRRWR